MTFLLAPLVAVAEETAAAYAQQCASCHGVDRLGGSGPALLPENLERLRRPEALKVITAGRVATQMPGFGDKLKPDEIEALASHIYAPLAQAPQWGEREIRASRVEHHQPGSLPDKPAFKADPLNLFVVVEGGDHHVTILDGDRFEPLHRFASRYALHGGPKFTPEGRYVFFASRDGWVSKFDLYNLKTVAEIRAAACSRNTSTTSSSRPRITC